MRYQLSEDNHLLPNGGWQDWSEFDEKNELSVDGQAATLDREWDDTWHAGIAFAHREGTQAGYSLGFAYESSPAKNEHRTFNLTVNEIYKVSASYFWQDNRQLDFSLGSTL